MLRLPFSKLSLCFAASALALGACGDDSGTTSTSAGNDSSTGDATTDPGTTNPGTTDPGTTDPGTTDPGTTDPGTTDPSTTDPDTTAGDTDGPTDSGTTAAPPACGDGAIDDGETCDDANTDDGDGCDSECAIEEGWECDGAEPSACATVCGDGIMAGDEVCDDGDKIDTNDCTNACEMAVCGDNIVWEGMETCDDGGTDPGDGCDDMCQIESEAGVACDDAVPPNCFDAAFFAVGSTATAGNLYAVSLDGATTVDIGPIGNSITGMAFHPDGTLYAVTSTAFNLPAGQLGTIDTTTGTFTSIGDLTDGVTNHPSMPDIAFVGDTLYGWTETGDDLSTIDLATGAVTVITAAEGSFGTAMAYNSADDTLLLAPDGSSGPLWTLDTLGGLIAGPTLGGTQGVVKGMSYADGVLYGMDTANGDGAIGDFVTYDMATGTATILSVLPGANIDAIAVYDPGNAAGPVMPPPPPPMP